MAETKRPIFGEPKQPSLFQEGAQLMGKGALIGAAIAFIPVVFIWLFVALGETLPPESKEAPDPSFGSLELPADRGIA
jgi:hypothetical protein